MRYATMAAAVLVVVSILAASVVIYVGSEESRQIRQDLYDKYDIDDYNRELEENGQSTWDPGRLYPGSIDSEIGSPEMHTDSFRQSEGTTASCFRAISVGVYRFSDNPYLL